MNEKQRADASAYHAQHRVEASKLSKCETALSATGLK
jgi:hypothetical protein